MKDLIDVHVHVAAFPTGDNGCEMSPAFQKGTLVRLIKWKLGLEGATNAEVNRSYVQRLVRDIDASLHVRRAVLLALDGVYDDAGRFDAARTHMMIGNDCVKKIVDEFPDRFLFGASVNPQRRDALDELARVYAGGARLVKVLPPSQVFDPMESRYKPYYRFLADKKLPLLCHIGYEFSVTAGKQEYGLPDHLRLALDEGVPVIAAHACSSAIFFQGRFGRALDELIARYPNFYLDLSAVTLPNRASIVFKLRRHPEWANRFLFGTDYPLSAYATPFVGFLGIARQWRLWRTKSIFDKQAEVLSAMGIHVDTGVTRRLLRLDQGGLS